KEVHERSDCWTDGHGVGGRARSIARNLGAGKASCRACSRTGQNPSMGVGVGDEGKPGFPLPLTEPFVAAEEERPVADNGSPDGRPELIALELGQAWIVRFALYVKKVSRIQIVIAVEFINVAMQFVAARFADGGDDSAGVPTILIAVCDRQHAKLA